MVLYHCNLGAVMSEARKAGEYLGLGRSLLEDLVEYYEGYPPPLYGYHNSVKTRVYLGCRGIKI